MHWKAYWTRADRNRRNAIFIGINDWWVYAALPYFPYGCICPYIKWESSSPARPIALQNPLSRHFALTSPPRILLFASSNCADKQRSFRGGFEEAKRRIRGEITKLHAFDTFHKLFQAFCPNFPCAPVYVTP